MIEFLFLPTRNFTDGWLNQGDRYDPHALGNAHDLIISMRVAK
jgi:hypothetical protein